MIPGPDKVIEYPQCGTLARVFTLVSGNTFGARNWSDGKSEAPMLPRRPKVSRCLNCSHYYWVSNAKIVGEVETIGGPDLGVDPTWLKAPMVEEPSFTEYLEAIELGLAKTTEEEEFLRVMAWWRDNDRYRENPEEHSLGPSGRSPESDANLRRLLSVFRDDTWQGDIMKSEIYRQSGDFDQAISLLENLPTEAPEEVVSRLQGLAMESNPKVVEL